MASFEITLFPQSLVKNQALRKHRSMEDLNLEGISVFFFSVKPPRFSVKQTLEKKKSRWIFFYREKSIVIFLTRINSKSHREVFEHIYHIYRENLNRNFLPRKTWPRLFTKKKFTEMFYREKLAETFYQEKMHRDFFRGKTDLYFIFHRENLNRVFLPRKAWPRFFTEKKWPRKNGPRFFTEKKIERNVLPRKLESRFFTEKNWPRFSIIFWNPKLLPRKIDRYISPRKTWLRFLPRKCRKCSTFSLAGSRSFLGGVQKIFPGASPPDPLFSLVGSLRSPKFLKGLAPLARIFSGENYFPAQSLKKKNVENSFSLKIFILIVVLQWFWSNFDNL